MGLLDILNSIQSSGAANDPRARPAPAPTSQSMSPIAKAMLALLALYAAKNIRMGGATQQQPTGGAGGNVASGEPGGGLGDLLGGVLGGGRPGGSAPAGGGLGDLLRGPLGGILGGAAAGTVLNGGLGRLVEQFQQAGQGDAARSWVGSGPNKMISQDDLATALGADTLETLANQTGMDHDEMLAGLSRQLPGFIDQLTPNGRLPTDEEAREMM